MPKGARYAVPYSKEPLLGCDPTHQGVVLVPLVPQREGRPSHRVAEGITRRKAFRMVETEGDSKNA
jgi:hypothetical protein